MQSQLPNQNQGLGNLKITFGPNQANARMILYVIPIFLLVGIILIGSIPIGGIGMWVIAAGLFWGYRAQLRARVEVYEQGITLTDWMGRHQAFWWEDVAAVYESIGYHQRSGAPNQWLYKIHLMEGRQIKLDMAYEKVSQLGRTVLIETGKRFLQEYREQYRTSKTVPIGDGLGMNAQGFVAGGDTLPWDQVSEIEINRRGDLLIHQQERRMAWKLWMHPRIANFPTFRAFLHEIGESGIIQSLIEDPHYEQIQKIRERQR